MSRKSSQTWKESTDSYPVDRRREKLLWTKREGLFETRRFGRALTNMKYIRVVANLIITVLVLLFWPKIPHNWLSPVLWTCWALILAIAYIPLPNRK